MQSVDLHDTIDKERSIQNTKARRTDPSWGPGRTLSAHPSAHPSSACIRRGW